MRWTSPRASTISNAGANARMISMTSSYKRKDCFCDKKTAFPYICTPDFTIFWLKKVVTFSTVRLDVSDKQKLRLYLVKEQVVLVNTSLQSLVLHPEQKESFDDFSYQKKKGFILTTRIQSTLSIAIYS